MMTHSARKEASRTEGLCTPECFRPDGFTILDATAFVRIVEGLTLRAGVFNILDEQYAWWSDVRGHASTSAITDASTQPGRNASVSLTFRFLTQEGLPRTTINATPPPACLSSPNPYPPWP